MISGNKGLSIKFILLTIILIVCFILNICLGSVEIPLEAVWDSLWGSDAVKSSWKHIILNYRLPKASTAVLVGSGLGVAGLLMQTLFRNPMAGPFVLGISSGASLGVAILILGASTFGGFLTTIASNSSSIVLASSLGSFLVLSIVVIVAQKIQNTLALLLIGLMFGSMTGAIVSILAYFAPPKSLQQYIFWGFGSLGNLSWNEVILLFIISIIAMALAITVLKPLNALLLGEQYAESLGINLALNRNLIIVATCLLAGSITAFAGPIAFVGLAVPHLIRISFQTIDHRVLLPAVVLGGGILLLLCDSISQLPGSAYVLPINAITSLIGGPVVIWLLVRKRNSFF